MQSRIHDREALLAISPKALSIYARTAGWIRHGSYREHSDIYVGDRLPEIIVPLTQRLGDYATVVASLIQTFAEVADQDELAVYRSLVTANRDMIRVKAGGSDDGSLRLNEAVSLIKGVSDLVLSVACSLDDLRPVYRPGANREAVDLLREMRLGQTEQGSFVVNLLTPVVPSPMPALFEDPQDQSAPIARRMTRRLAGALAEAHQTVERADTDDGADFDRLVNSGVSANFCEALVKIIEPFVALDIVILWAQTRPMEKLATVCRFGQADAASLHEAARSLRERAPKLDTCLHGFVRILKRSKKDTDGTIRLRTQIDGKQQSVMAVLEQADYERAVQAHNDRAMVMLKGDLERTGQRWRLLNPQLNSVLHNEAHDSEPG